MTLEAPQVTRRGDQPVPEIRVTLEELVAAHGWLSTTVRNGWGSASPPTPTQGVGRQVSGVGVPDLVTALTPNTQHPTPWVGGGGGAGGLRPPPRPRAPPPRRRCGAPCLAAPPPPPLGST